MIEECFLCYTLVLINSLLLGYVVGVILYLMSVRTRQVHARTPSSPAFAICMLDDVRRRQEKKNLSMASRAPASFADDRRWRR